MFISKLFGFKQLFLKFGFIAIVFALISGAAAHPYGENNFIKSNGDFKNETAASHVAAANRTSTNNTDALSHPKAQYGDKSSGLLHDFVSAIPFLDTELDDKSVVVMMFFLIAVWASALGMFSILHTEGAVHFFIGCLILGLAAWFTLMVFGVTT